MHAPVLDPNQEMFWLYEPVIVRCPLGSIYRFKFEPVDNLWDQFIHL